MGSEKRELASDGVIMDMCFCPRRNEFAYSSSDRLVYIRKFSPSGASMRLVNVLRGHEDDVTSIRSNAISDQWVSSSLDNTIRLWSTQGQNPCVGVIVCSSPQATFCCDGSLGHILVADGAQLRVVDSREMGVLQTTRAADAQSAHSAHDPHSTHTQHSEHSTDSPVLTVAHIRERELYATGHADGTVRLWGAYREHALHRPTSELSATATPTATAPDAALPLPLPLLTDQTDQSLLAQQAQQTQSFSREAALRDVPVYTVVRGPDLDKDSTVEARPVLFYH